MGVGRAHHHRIGLPGQVHVVGVTAIAGDEAQVLPAANRLSDMGAGGFLGHVLRFRFCRIARGANSLFPLPLAGEG